MFFYADYCIKKKPMKNKRLITISILAAILVIVAGTAFYKFNFTKDDVFFDGKSIKSTDHQQFYGAWIEYNREEISKQAIGFVLKADGTASSINSATLVYKKWKISGDKLILTSISLGNHLLSVDNDSLQITSYNNKQLFLKRGTQEFCFVKTNKEADKEILHDITFNYCPVNVEEVNTIAQTHAAIDWKSNARANKYRSVITQSYSKGKANFAGYYQVITWGCGSGCQEGIMIDTRNGKIYNLPTAKGYQDIGTGSQQEFESILLITYTSTQNPTTQKEDLDNRYWLWNENTKEFIRYK